MKIIFLLFFVFAFNFQNLFSQSFLTENKIWTVPDGWGQIEYFFLNGDTTIGGINYKYLFSSTDSALSVSQPRGTMNEDSSGKVFHNGNLLYDFNLNIGDTFYAPWGFCPAMVVLNIDTILLLNGESRRRMDMGAEFWIEGIGSTNGLLNVDYQCQFLDYWVTLNCFIENDTVKYQGLTNLPCYDRLLGIEKLKNNKRFSVFPNPLSGNAVIEFYSPVNDGLLIFYDSVGREIRKMENISGFKIFINRDGLPAGIYYFVLYENEYNTRGKIIVQ